MAMQAEEPIYLEVGTEISAKFKGAFCEAKVKRVQKSIKCKVTLKESPWGSLVVEDSALLKGEAVVNSTVEVALTSSAKASAKATVISVKDSSLYTVVFDDGDERELRRTAICLKGAKHFANTENLDTMPLTSPEHFGTPVSTAATTAKAAAVSSAKKASAKAKAKSTKPKPNDDDDDVSDELESSAPLAPPKLGLADAGKAVLLADETPGKRRPVAALLVRPEQQKSIHLKKNELLIRCFKDGRYLAAKKESLSLFTVAATKKMDSGSLAKLGYDLAVAYLDRSALPVDWDGQASSSSSEGGGSEASDSEEHPGDADRFVAQLYKFHEEKGTPINRPPVLAGKDVNLYKFYRVVAKAGGFNKVNAQTNWRRVGERLGLASTPPTTLRNCYSRYLQNFDSVYRQLRWTMDTGGGESKRPLPRSRRVPSGPPPVSLKKDEARPSSTGVCSSARDIKPTHAKKSSNSPVPGPHIVGSISHRKTGRDRSGSDGSDAKSSKSSKDIPVKESGKKVRKPWAAELEGETTEEEEENSPIRRDATTERLSLAVGQRIKALFGTNEANRMWYDAKVLQIDAGGERFYIHYMGWKRRFDEWVQPSRVQIIPESDAKSAAQPPPPPPPPANLQPSSSSTESTDDGKSKAPKTSQAPSARAHSGRRQRADQISGESSDEGNESSATETKQDAKRRKVSPPSPQPIEEEPQEQVEPEEEMKEEPATEEDDGEDEAELGSPKAVPEEAEEAIAEIMDETKAKPILTRAARRAAGEMEEALDALPMYPRPKSRDGNGRRSSTTPRPPTATPPAESGSSEAADSRKPSSDASDDDDAAALEEAQRETPLGREGSGTPNADGDDEDNDDEDEEPASTPVSAANRGRGRWRRKRRRGGYASGESSRKSSTIAKPTTPRKDGSAEEEDGSGDGTPPSRKESCLSPKDNLSALKARLQAQIESNPAAFPSRFNFCTFDSSMTSEEKMSAMALRMEEIKDLHAKLKAQLTDVDRKYRRALERQSKSAEEEERRKIEEEVVGILAAAGGSS